MLKKRITSMLLALTMVVGLGSQAFAAEIEAARVEAQVMNEIEAEQAEVFAEVYAQLEAQGRLDHYDMYVGILAPKIEASIREERGLAVPYSTLGVRAVSTPKYAPNGGILLYTQTGLASVVETYFDKKDTEELFLQPYAKKVELWEKIEPWVSQGSDDFVDYVAETTNGMTALQIKAMKEAYKFMLTMFIATQYIPVDQITDSAKAKGHAYTVQIHEPTENTTSNIVLAWSHYPNVYVPTSNVKNVSWNPKG